jgi:thymidylate kinase
MRIVAVSGVDGSGKSTFISDLANALGREDASTDVASAWLRFNPRARGRSTTGGATGVVSTLDERHRGNPVKRAARRVGGRKAWMALATRLYRTQLRWQLSALGQHDVVLADRFTLDFAADNVGSGQIREDEVPDVLARLPAADASFVLTVSDDVLDQRRDPREPLERLRERRDLYLRLAERLGYPVVDTTQPGWQDDVLAVLRRAGVR